MFIIKTVQWLNYKYHIKSYNTAKSQAQESNALLGMRIYTIVCLDQAVIAVSLAERQEICSCIFVVGRRMEDLSFFLEMSSVFCICV